MKMESKNPYRLSSLVLSGFRAYLKPHLFDLSGKPCLAVFAPNGSGKTSIVDSLEFFFSEDGTLERLGLRKVQNQAGPEALPHNLADQEKIPSFVFCQFKRGQEKTDGTRVATGADREMPAVAATVRSMFKADPLIKGFALRRFVEAETEEQRYESIAGWLQLGPFVEVQRNLRALLHAVKTASEELAPFERVNTQLSKKTKGTLNGWVETEVLSFANGLLGKLDETLVLGSFDGTDVALAAARKRKKKEEESVGLAGTRQLRNSLVSVHDEVEDPDDPNKKLLKGFLPSFVAATENLSAAEEKEKKERSKAADAAFEELWAAAEPLFAEGGPDQTVCPICSTPFSDSVVGSVEGARKHIKERREALREYAAAKRGLDGARGAVRTARVQLLAGLRAVIPLLTKEHEKLKGDLEDLIERIEAWKSGPPPDPTTARSSVLSCTSDLEKTITRLEAEQGEDTYSWVVSNIEDLISLKEEWAQATRNKEELENLTAALDSQISFVKGEIRDQVQTRLDSLEGPVNRIYGLIQGPEATPIRFELPREEDRNQQRLKLVIDFAPNRKGVQPSGYLSDSQIHSLALALRLASVKRFNSDAPLLILDDIVTSYDADHRRSIAAMLASEFEGFQVLLTTHDERFFVYLKDQLGDRRWQFKRILRLDPDHGPRFQDHRVTAEMIEARWEKGESAANEIRQAEEEWLLGICLQFGVDIRIRSAERAYSYDRAELAGALAAFLNKQKMEPPLVPGVNNRFLSSLQTGAVENFGSHFQPNPYGKGSKGDEMARWEEFSTFQKFFVCPKCGRSLFKRPLGMKSPVCANEKCETKFEFSPLKEEEPGPNGGDGEAKM